MILSAQTILKRKIVTPSEPKTVVRGMSYGISAAGYDVRVDFSTCLYSARKMWVPPAYHPGVPLDVYDNESSFLLAATMEHFDMPDDVVGYVKDKSSWARKGLAVQNTVVEPGWRGYLTLELTMHGPGEITLQHGDPIAQIVFHQLDEPTIFPYTGKYQDQERGPQPAREEKV